MPLLADDPADRARQIVDLTERLTHLLESETALLNAHEPPLSGAESEEKGRLANLYRQEMARIAGDRTLIRTAPAALIDRMRAATVRFRAALAAHERALIGVKEVTEGLVKAIAEEVARVRGGPRGYGASGGYAEAPANVNAALALNKTA
ncbi:MAG: flagellar basal body protein [Hyphomonadaceae bacterium]